MGIELKATLKARKLLIPLNEKNGKNTEFTQVRYGAGTRKGPREMAEIGARPSSQACCRDSEQFISICNDIQEHVSGIQSHCKEVLDITIVYLAVHPRREGLLQSASVLPTKRA